MTRRSRGILALVVAALALSPGVEAYLRLGALAGSRLVSIQWTQFPIRYFVTDRDAAGVSATQLQAAADRAFGTWSAVPNTTIAAQFIGFVGAEPFQDDGISVIGFRERADLDRTLAATTFEIDTITGAILESDIFFNSTFEWSVATGGSAGRFDVESIAVHEIGHLLGLGHSALGETQSQAGGGRTVLGKRAVMFPIAYPRGNIEDRTLEADDISGITEIYGSSAANRDLGAIQGRVTLNGAGVFGAHVTAFNSATGALVSGFSLNQQGEFVIASLQPGVYVLRVEPLDDADIDSFFDEEPVVNLNFRAAYHASLVAVPAGGAGPSVEIKVQSK